MDVNALLALRDRLAEISGSDREADARYTCFVEEVSFVRVRPGPDNGEGEYFYRRRAGRNRIEEGTVDVPFRVTEPTTGLSFVIGEIDRVAPGSSFGFERGADGMSRASIRSHDGIAAAGSSGSPSVALLSALVRLLIDTEMLPLPAPRFVQSRSPARASATA